MNKKVVVSTLMALVAGASIASAAPQTTWDQGEWQLDLGAWAPKAKVDGVSSDTKWNFNGGLGYAISSKWALRYDYHGLKTKAGEFKTDGDEHEVNLVYSLGKNVALFGGWNRINNDLGKLGSDTNNVAQFGVATKFPLAKNLALYADGALGTEKTSLWEAGLAYTINKDWDLNAGYRYVDTKLTDDNNIKYRGFLVGLSYRFGGHKAAPVAAPVAEPEPYTAPAEPAHVYNDYYLDSIRRRPAPGLRKSQNGSHRSRRQESSGFDLQTGRQHGLRRFRGLQRRPVQAPRRQRGQVRDGQRRCFRPRTDGLQGREQSGLDQCHGTGQSGQPPRRRLGT